MKPLFDDAKPAAQRKPAVIDVDVIERTPSLTKLSEAVSVGALAPIAEPPRPQFHAPVAVNEAQISALGARATGGLSKISTELMGSIKAADAGAFGEDLNNLVRLAKGLNPRGESTGLLARAKGLFSSARERLMAQYNSVETQMNGVVAELDKKAAQQKVRIAQMNQMYDANVQYHQELEAAHRQGSEWLAALQSQPVTQPKDAFEAQAIAEQQRLVARLGKRLDDLTRAMLLAKQTAPQIRLMQDNADGLVQKLEDLKAVTLPAWRNAFSLYLLNMEQQKTKDLANAVDEATDAALRQGAELLRQNAGEIAKARQRSVVSLETLEHVQQQLLGAFDDIDQANREATAARAAALPKIQALETELITRFVPGQR